VDCESERVVAQVKHVQRLSLAQLEALALKITALGGEQDKIGLVVVKRRAGRGKEIPGLVVPPTTGSGKRSPRRYGGCSHPFPVSRAQLRL